MTISTRTIPPTVDVAGNRLAVFVESGPYLSALIDDVRAARHRVWIESYTVADDAAGRAVAAALKERAAAGVECRLMYDAVGSFGTPSAFFDDLRRAGVDVLCYRPWGSWWRGLRVLPQFHRRDHRKLAAVDDVVGYFGGMNLVDQGGSAVPPLEGARHPSSQAGWRDVQVRLVGPAAKSIAAALDDLWSRGRNRTVEPRRNPQVGDILSARSDALFFFDARPHVRHRRPGPVFKALIGRAHKSITLAMAYFLPFGGVLRELLRARRRGVTVRVIVPHESDVPLVQWAARHMYERLLRHGIRIYERRDRMLHSKVMVIDGLWSVVGSCNFDPRSMLLNLEFFAVVRSADFARALNDVCRDERRQSDPVRLSRCRSRGWWESWLYRITWTFRRWL